MIYQYNTYYNNEKYIEEKTTNKFKKEIDLLNQEFLNKIKKINNNIKNNINLFSDTMYHININDFINEKEWNEINEKIYSHIETFFHFHTTVSSFLFDLKSFLYNLNPAWDAFGAISEFLSAYRDSGGTGNQYIDGTVAIGEVVSTFLSFLHQNEKNLEYSKQFILNIFSIILETTKLKNIEKLNEVLKVSNEILNKMEYKYYNFFSLWVSQKKVDKTYKVVNKFFLLAKNRYETHLRTSAWDGDNY